MNTQQLIEAIKVATKTKNHFVKSNGGWIAVKEFSYIDADAFLAAVERVQATEWHDNIVGVAKDIVWPKK